MTLDIDALADLLSAAQGAAQRGDAAPAIELLTAAPLIGGHPVLDLTRLTPSANPPMLDVDSEVVTQQLVTRLEQLRTHLLLAPSVWRTREIGAGVWLAHAARVTDDIAFEDVPGDVDAGLRYTALTISAPGEVLVVAIEADDRTRVLRTPVGVQGAMLLHPGVNELVTGIATAMLGTRPSA
jgi:hypothetical protein